MKPNNIFSYKRDVKKNTADPTFEDKRTIRKVCQKKSYETTF